MIRDNSKAMTAFEFRLRFRLPSTAFIAEQAEAILVNIPESNQQILLQSRPANSLMETVLLEAIGSDFPSMETAVSSGRKIRDAIMVCCALLGMGVEIGKHEEFFDETQVRKAESSEQTYVQPYKIDGLLVYPQNVKIEYLGVNVSTRGGNRSVG